MGALFADFRNIERVPESNFVDSANTLKKQSYLLRGLKGGYHNDQWSAGIEGRNLGNRKYIASASIIDRANPTLPLFEPGTGPGVFGGVKISHQLDAA